MNHLVKTRADIKAMRQGGRILAEVLDYTSAKVVGGISTKELSDLADRELRSLGGSPAFLGYQGFPEPICISVNDEVVHGIPRPNKLLKNGDIVSLDLGVRYDGMIVDGAISLLCGSSNEEKDRLLTATRRSLEAGISVIKDGVKTGDVGYAIQAVLEKAKLGIVRDLVGHGVGHEVHEDPNVPNFGRRGTGFMLREGMTIAVEPMATLGKDAVYTDVDGWTIRTKDGSLSAHFEHTVLVTATGVEILTCKPR